VALSRAAFASDGVSVACGTVVSVPEAVLTVAGKKSLFSQSQALAVDMESAGIARAAKERHLPFFILRAICDPAEEAVPRALSESLDENGGVRPFALLRSLSARPSLLLDMVRMGRHFTAAGHALKTGWRIQMRCGLPHRLASAWVAGEGGPDGFSAAI
jgi:adenosylhomocysteine nucleosidase